MVFSASSMSNTYFYDGDALYFTRKQAIAIVLGLFGMFVTNNIHYSKLKKLTLPFFLVVFVALLLVPYIGHEANGARSWFKVGPLSLQPAEFAKLSLIMYLAYLISNKKERYLDFKHGLLPALVVTCIMTGLILLQPDFGTAMVLMLISLVLLAVGGANLKHLGLTVGAGAAAGSLGLAILLLAKPTIVNSHHFDRIYAFLDPWADERGIGWHIVNSMYAFGHGGLTGAGFGQSVQKLHYLPAPHNDFIFSIIGEELGFIGATIFLLVYLLFLWRGLVVALRCPDPFGNLVGVGIVLMIGIQALINLCGVTNMIPLTGVTLPLISYGGSSMLVTLTSIGILLGLSREQRQRKS